MIVLKIIPMMSLGISLADIRISGFPQSTRIPNSPITRNLLSLSALKHAKNEILLFTDADCKPESDKWLRGIDLTFR